MLFRRITFQTLSFEWKIFNLPLSLHFCCNLQGPFVAFHCTLRKLRSCFIKQSAGQQRVSFSCFFFLFSRRCPLNCKQLNILTIAMHVEVTNFDGNRKWKQIERKANERNLRILNTWSLLKISLTLVTQLFRTGKCLINLNVAQSEFEGKVFCVLIVPKHKKKYF